MQTIIFTLLATLLAADFAMARTAYTTADVNVRNSPWGRILTGIPDGTKVKVLSVRNGFSRVSFLGGRIGWISNSYVAKNKSSRAGTEAEYCKGCLDPLVADTVSQASHQIKEMARYGRGAVCMSNKLIQAAKAVIRSKYGNRKYGRGLCALAVRQTLNKADFWTGGGIGDAKDMLPGLKRIGYKNIITPGMTPDTAPNGTILVYGTPKNKRGCRGKGNIYGHVEIKENSKSFLYDGKVTRDIQKAFGARCRPLIGVMVMGDDCPTCKPSVKRSCGV